MSDSSDDLLGRVETALEAYFAADSAREMLDAVDLQALLAEGEIDAAVDYEQATVVVGRLVGRALVRDVIGRTPAGPVVDDVVGYGVGAQLGEAVAEWLLEQYDASELLSAIEAELDRSLGVVDVDGGDLEGGVNVDVEGPGDEE